MKGLEQLSLHIAIPVDKAEIGSIREYFRFCGSRTSAGHFEYARNRAKPNSNCTLPWNLNSALITISTTNYPENLLQGYIATSPPTESFSSTCKSKNLDTYYIYCSPIQAKGTRMLHDTSKLKRVLKKVETGNPQGS